MVRQDTVLELTAPGLAHVHSEYEMDVDGLQFETDAAFKFETWSVTEGGIKPTQLVEEHLRFSVEVNGYPVPEGDIEYFFKDTMPKDYTRVLVAVFPLKFEKGGINKVVIDYSYELSKPFKEFAKSGAAIGWDYDLAPTKYWAGKVEGIKCRVILKGVDMDWISIIDPCSFKFNADGWEWTLENPNDNKTFINPLQIMIGEPFRLYWDITTVTSKKGLEVKDTPDPAGTVIHRLKKGDRLYCYISARDDTFLWENLYREGWRRCRLFDNTEGFIQAYDPASGERYVECPAMYIERKPEGKDENRIPEYTENKPADPAWGIYNR